MYKTNVHLILRSSLTLNFIIKNDLNPKIYKRMYLLKI